MAFSSDGAKMFVIGTAGKDVNEYVLPTPFDASTRKFVDATSVSEQEVNPRGIAFSNDGTRMFVIDSTEGDVNEYALSSVYPVTATRTPPTFDSSELDLDAGVLTITFSETINTTNIVPTKIHIRETGNYTHGTTLSAGELDTDADGATISFNLTAPHLAAVAGLTAPELTIEPGAVWDEYGNLIVSTFDASTRTFVNATSISDQEESDPQGMAFSNDGAKMFILDAIGNDINEYDLSSPFDASTRSFVSATGIGGQEINPRGIAFSNDGAKMFVIGIGGDDVNEYDLFPPFDASTRSFVSATGISQVDFPQGIAFSNDGVKMFVIDTLGDDVNEYDLSAPFDASTRKFVNATSISSQETTPTGMAFSNDGAKMFVIGKSGDDVNEYTLFPPFDASTRKFVDATSIRLQETAPTGMAFSSDGAKMFVIGSNKDNVNEYALSSVYPITLTDITVSDTPPVLDDISPKMVDEHKPLSFTVTAVDDDSVTLEYSLTGNEPNGAAITSAGEFTWTPSEEQDGTHIFEVSVSDLSGGTDTQDITVTVNEVNVAPVLNAIGDQTVNEFVELTFTATASDTDVVDNAVNTLTFLLDGIVPTGAAITPAGVFTWTPTESQVGPHDITVQVTDSSLTDSETLMVTVRDVNVAPVLNTIGDQTANEFVELTFTATASDDDALTFLLDGIVPTGAAITPAGVFTWTPTESQDGDHTITVQVTDGSLTDSETLTVTVNEVNVAPVLNAIGDQTVNEFVELTFTATASDTDVVDNAVNTLTFLLDGIVPTGAAITPAGVFTWTPTESQVGPHDITVQVTDSSLTDSETLMVTVRDVNVAPVLNTIGDQTANEFVELTFTATASDDDALTFLLDGIVPTGAAITPAGVFTWTPTESQDGDHTITVQVTDGSLTDSETLTVTVNEVNVAPVLNAIGDKGTSELVELTFTATASDTDVVGNAVNTLTFLLDGIVPTGAAITPAGVFTWTPTESQVGPHDITVQVTDGSLTDSETLTVTVRDVNVAPVLNTIGDQTANEFVELTFTATASDDDALTFLLDGIVPTGAAITPAGVFTWTPTESQDGDHTITVQVTDGSLTDSETLTVTVNEVNVAPVLNAIGDQTVNEFVELTFTATASDTDVVDNVVNTLTFSLDGTVPLDAVITSAGVFTWTPTESQVGPHDITVQVTDGSLTDSETLTVTVHDIAPLPVSARASSSFAIALTLSEVVTSGEQGPNGFSVTTGGDPVSVESITGSGTTTLTLNLDGTISASDGVVRLSYSDATGDVADENGNPLASFSDLDVLFPSQRRGGTTPPAVDLGTLAYQRSVDIPPHIAEQIASHDASEPLEPITPDGTFDFPLVINGYGYLLDDVTNTLVPQILTVGDDDPATITFTVYTQKDLAHFILHLNLQGENTDYADSDTYITYKNDDGTTGVTDPHGYIGSATVTVTQEDDSVPERKTVRITVEFGEEPMGSTNMVAYMWNTDRKATFIKIIDAFEVVAVLPESAMQAADPEPLEPDSELPADPEPVVPGSEMPADPEPILSDTMGPGDYDEAQVLSLIRMWSGFESEMITDEQLLTSLGLDYPDADIPDWMMTELGVLVAKGDVTVGEFVLALQYVLENIHGGRLG